MPFDWQQFHANETRTPAVVDPRRRLRICLAGFVAALAVVFGRAVQLEVTQGADFREEALRPIEITIVLPAARGRILARDGSVLACDTTVQAVAVQYRWLQEPPDPRWLRITARSRMSKADRKDPRKLAAAQDALLAQHVDLMQRLAHLCGLSQQQWAARTKRIQARVQQIADDTNKRRQTEAAEPDSANDSWPTRIRRLLLDDPPPPRITVTEESDFHVVTYDVPPSVVAEIQNNADRYIGVKVVEVSRRSYPGGTLAAHLLGHLGPVEKKELAEQAVVGQVANLPESRQIDNLPPKEPYLPTDLVGRMGVERQYESQLRGRRGAVVEQTDRSGRVLTHFEREPAVNGHDVVLSLDPALQRTAEELLHSALERRALRPDVAEPAGGAIVVMEIDTGAILAAVSAPAFDPNLFVRGSSEELTALLADKSHPLFDRVGRMAIPPGSTFKMLTAAALLESAAVTPQEPFSCQGYLDQPDRHRCEIYVRQGVGHGEVDLADALAVSCNVYFFHFAQQMGPRPLVDWASRFGFGRPTGMDLPGEASGNLPSPENIRQLDGRARRSADTLATAIGQGSLSATPLQVLCLTAAVANGGRLVTPHVVQFVEGDEPAVSAAPPQPIPGLRAKTLRAIREGLCRVVADPEGTAHGTVFVKSLAIAGKTGTAETGAGLASHAWFAGYVPADEPKLAFVVVLEHAGEASTAVGPLAKRLALRMKDLGML